MAANPVFQGDTKFIAGELTSVGATQVNVLPAAGVGRCVKSIWVEYKGSLGIELQRYGKTFARRDVVGTGHLELLDTLLLNSVFADSSVAAGVPWDVVALALKIVGLGVGDYVHYRCTYREM